MKHYKVMKFLRYRFYSCYFNLFLAIKYFVQHQDGIAGKILWKFVLDNSMNRSVIIWMVGMGHINIGNSKNKFDVISWKAIIFEQKLCKRETVLGPVFME